MKRLAWTLFGLASMLLGVISSALAAPGAGSVLDYGEGSMVSIEVSPGFWLDVPITADGGLVIGESQGGEGVDRPFNLFGKQAWHVTSGVVTVISNSELDFSRWGLVWGDMNLSLGDAGVATLTCQYTCSKGETYTLDYSTVLPAQAAELSGLGYRLHLAGAVR